MRPGTAVMPSCVAGTGRQRVGPCHPQTSPCARCDDRCGGPCANRPEAAQGRSVRAPLAHRFAAPLEAAHAWDKLLMFEQLLEAAVDLDRSPPLLMQGVAQYDCSKNSGRMPRLPAINARCAALRWPARTNLDCRRQECPAVLRGAVAVGFNCLLHCPAD